MIKVKFNDKVYDAIDYPNKNYGELYQLYSNYNVFPMTASINYKEDKYKYAFNINKLRGIRIDKIYLGGE